MKSVSVFCGSKSGKSPVYVDKTKALGGILAKNRIDVIYGGACIGLMGELADAVIAHGGNIIGVSPHFLVDMEVHHNALSSLIMVDNMHQRKEKMYELSDAFFILPGGCGTLDEFFEIFTWAQLGLHNKPIVIFNWNNFYDLLIAHMKKMVQEGFLNDIGIKRVKIINSYTETMDFITNN